MKQIQRLLRISLTTCILTLVCNASASNAPLPDSLLTKDHVYEYTFSNFPLACRIMDRLRADATLPAHRLDITEGDLYFNNGYYHRALKCYQRALESDSVRLRPDDLMEQLHRMISTYDCLHNDTKKAEYVRLLLNKADAAGNHAMHSIALFNLGKMIYYQGNKPTGYRYMYQAVDEMRATDYEYKFDNLRYNYNTLLVMQQRDRRYEEALRTLDALESVATEAQGSEPHMEGLDSKELKALYANRAVVLHRLGRRQEAEQFYHRFLALDKDQDRDNYLIMPYLSDRRMYDDIIRMNTTREAFLKAQGDTVTYHMTTIKRSLGEVYETKGDYRRAAAYFKQLAVLRDSIKNREQHSAALELAALYENNEQDALLQRQTSELRERNIYLLSTAGLVLLLAIGLWRSIRYNHIIRRKNRVMTQGISEQIDYREKLQGSRNIICDLQQQIEKVQEELREKDTLLLAGNAEKQMETDKKETDKMGTDKKEAVETNAIGTEAIEAETSGTIASGPENATANTAEAMYPGLNIAPFDRADDDKFFEWMESFLDKYHPYLDSNFNTISLTQLTGINRNRLNNILMQHANCTIAVYINNLRIEHAAKLIREHPGYIISHIAEKCGLPNTSTFHRLFRERYTMTPAEYKKETVAAANEQKAAAARTNKY